MTNESRVRRDLLLGASVLVCSVLVPVVFLPNWDVAWHFEMAQRLLEGGKLYDEILDVNLPLAIYIYVPFVFLSNLIGGSPYFWLSCGIANLIMLSIVVKERCTLVARSRRDWRQLGGSIGLVFVLAFLPAISFGKLEHLAVLLTLPYLLARLSGSARPNELRMTELVTLSILAGVGFSLKPFFLLPWLVSQFVVTRREWNERNVLLIVLSGLPMALQFLAITIYFPDLIGLYQTFGASYAAFWHVPTHLILQDTLYIPAALTILLVSSGMVLESHRILVRGFGWIGLAWFVTGLVQGKGWNYHFLPAQLMLILGGLSAVVYFGEAMRRRAVYGLIVASVLLTALAGLRNGIVELDYPARRSQLPSELRDLPDGMSALVLSVRMVSAYPLLGEIGSRNVGSLPIPWPLQVEYGQAGHPGRFVPVRLPLEMVTPESVLFTTVVDDMVARKPELVLVSDGTDPLFNDAYFDYVSYFSQDEAFRREMLRYEKGPKLGHLRFYIRQSSER